MSKDWFKCEVSEAIIKEYDEIMSTPFMERDEARRVALERQIATSVRADYSDESE